MRPKHSSTPTTVPAAPGRLIASQPFNAPWVPQTATAWRIHYTTTLDTHRPTIASALVIVSTASTGPVDAIVWAHGSTGISEDSAPSLSKKGLASGAMFVIDSIIEADWALIATDYPGLGSEGPHPWLIGDPAGRAVLDSIRAAQQLPTLTLRNTVIWGHSQGGHAALWAGGLHDGYAPDAPLRGVAALAPTADVPGVVANFRSAFGGHIFVAYAMQAYSTYYPDVPFRRSCVPVREDFFASSHGARSIIRSPSHSESECRCCEPKCGANIPLRACSGAASSKTSPAVRSASPCSCPKAFSTISFPSQVRTNTSPSNGLLGNTSTTVATTASSTSI
jgi:pimeloyl-ACP methyl ester carboxylesterase